MSQSTSVTTRGTVQANEPLCREHQRLIVRVRGLPTVTPGQFAHIIPAQRPAGPKLHDWPADGWPSIDSLTADGELTYRRAFSIAACRPHGDGLDITIIYRVVGRCTTWMSGLHAGDEISVLGPVGQGFRVTDTTRLALLVVGGVGLPAVLMLAEALSHRGVATVLFCGAQSADLLPLDIDDPEALCTTGTQPSFSGTELAHLGTGLIVSTDDGSSGYAGYVPGALCAYLDAHAIDPRSTTVYACGPEIMMRRVADLSAAATLPCQACMERPMACALGTCQSCVVPIHDDAAPEGWRYSLCCQEGPVYEAQRIIWE